MGNISRHSVCHFNKTRSYVIFAVIMILFLAILACSFDILPSDPSQQETGVAQSVEETLFAEQALTEQAIQTNQPSNTPVVPPESINMEATIQVQQATLDAQLTLVAKPSEIAPTATEVPTAVTVEPISITEWGMRFWVPLSSGCKIKEAGCWRMDDDYKKHLGGGELVMVSKNPVTIDQSWPNPHLVFWHKYKFASNARIEISIDSVWSIVRDYNKKQTGGNWVVEAINLNDHKGKQFLVRFIAGGISGSGGIPGSDWFVNDVQIVPNYTP